MKQLNFSIQVNAPKAKVWSTLHMAYPVNFMQVFMSMEEMIGAEYEKSLSNLKVILEKQ